MDLGLLNIFPFPADMMLSLVSRGHWRDTAGGKGFSSFTQHKKIPTGREMQEGRDMGTYVYV